MTDTTPQGPTKEQLADIAHKANEQQRAYMGLPPTDEQELRNQLRSLHVGVKSVGGVFSVLDAPTTEVILQLVAAQKQLWQIEARINEVHNFGNWNTSAKGDVELFDVIDVRLRQLKSQLNNPQEKENTNAN